MTEPNLVRSLLALFTTLEKAEEIEGDLIEQAQPHSRLWLWIQLVQVWFVLAFAAFRREPGYTLLLGYGIYELARRISYMIVQPIRLHVLRETELSMAVLMFVTYTCWAMAGYCIGVAMAYFLPKFAVRATLAAAFLVVLPQLGELLQFGNSNPPISHLLLFVVAPLLGGCFQVHHLRLAQSAHASRTKTI